MLLLSGIFLVAALLCEVDTYHCQPQAPIPCANDSDTLFTTLLKPRRYPYTMLSHCADSEHCDNSTNGTGHQLYDSLSEDIVSVERCYSFCFSNVTPSVISESGDEFSFVFESNLYRGDRCGRQLKEGFVCYSACLFRLEELNLVSEELVMIMSLHNQTIMSTTCAALCSAPHGICERALPQDASEDCKNHCHANICPAACQRVESSFPKTTSDSPLKYGGFLNVTFSSPENITLQKEGVMEYLVKYDIPPPGLGESAPLSGPLLSQSKAYGLIWRVSLDNSKVQYIPQHLPIFLLDEENELFRSGPNLLAIRSLQCKSMKVEFAIVDENGISSFINVSESTCFKGSWFPRPPGGFSTRFGFLRSTSDLAIEFKATELSPDDALVEEYRIQVLSGYQESPNPVKECEAAGDYQQLIADEKLERTGNGSLVLQVKRENDVKRFFPVYWRSCSYLILVYATPQRLHTASGRTIYPSADLNVVSVPFPDYDYIVLDANYTLERNNVTGKADVYIHVSVTSHWTSLAVLSKLGGILCLARSCGSSQSSPRTFVPATAVNTTFDIPYRSVTPHQPGEDKLYTWVPEFQYCYPKGRVEFPQIFTLEVPIYALPPGPVRNFSVIEQFNDLSNQLILNVSWMRPEYPQGNVKFYHLLVSSANVLSIDEEKIFPPDHGEDVVFEHQFVIDLAVDESMNVSIQTETEHGMKGDWQVFPIRNYFTVMPTQPSQPILWYLYLIAGLIVASFVILTSITTICVYYYCRKNKVVIGTNTNIFIGGTQVVEDGVEDVFQPVMVDSWEISPDYIIIDCMLGEGQFGEVYKATIRGIVNNPYFKGSQASFVAVKILRGEASASLKSDFLKEITMMKKITMENCPNVVNMVGCCTLQEPLALVQEYAPHGDLLTYLRTVRKLNSTTYFSVTSPTYLNHEKGDNNVNHVTSPTTPLTPMTPASTCPLVIQKDPCPPVPEHSPLPSHDGSIPFPNVKPYSSLGELKPAHLISFAHQIAHGMKFLSNLGIVHRDLACRNILVGENKTLKISDFGLARENNIYVKTTDGKLPLRWMAIESIADRIFTTKSDVWSFGIVLWEITTLGGHPYPSVSNKALLTQLLRGYRMEKPDNCSSELYEIMMNCWQVEVSDRPTFAELHTSLDILLTNAQSENYIDLNVDEMLPYYQVSSVQGDEEEMEEKDINPSNGYPDKTGLNHNYLQGDRRPVSNASGSSISSHNVSMQTANEREHSTVSTEGSKEEEQAPTDSNPSERKQTPTDTNPNEVKQTPTDTNSNDSEVKQTPTNTNPDEMKQTWVSIPQDHSTLTSSVLEECSKC